MTKPFIIINGDTLFRVDAIAELIQSDQNAALTKDVSSHDKEAIKVVYTDNKITAFVKGNDSKDEAFGLYKIVDVDAVRTALTSHIERSLVTKYYESALSQAISHGASFVSIASDGIEIDTPEDLQTAGEWLRENRTVTV